MTSFLRGLVVAVCTLGLLFVSSPAFAAPAGAVASVPRLAPMDKVDPKAPDDTTYDNTHSDMFSGDPKCRHYASTWYVPTDVDGKVFSYYCRDGHTGTFERNYPNFGTTSLKSWADGHGSVTGQFTFDDLLKDGKNPCKNLAKDTDLEEEQCAVIFPSKYPAPNNAKSKKLGQPDGLAPCQQWELLIRNLSAKHEAQPFNAGDTQHILDCVPLHPILQQSFTVKNRADPNAGYDVHDYSGPKSLIDKGLGPLLTYGIWLAMAMCVIGVLICAGRMALAYRGGAEESVVGVMWVLVACVLAGSSIGIGKMVLSG